MLMRAFAWCLVVAGALVACSRCERAWVLWVSLDHQTYVAREAFGNEKACKEELAKRMSRGAAADLVCLPETVDPHGNRKTGAR
jgi:hypothetical protein